MLVFKNISSSCSYWVHLCKKILHKLVLTKQISDSHTNFYWQNIIAEYIKNYNFSNNIKYLIYLYKGKFLSMENDLDEIDNSSLSYFKPEGGYFICCRLGTNVDVDKFYKLLEVRRIGVFREKDLKDILGSILPDQV